MLPQHPKHPPPRNMASAAEDERKPRKVRLVSSSEKHNRPSTTASRPAVEASGRSIPVSDSTIMPAFQLHRRRQLRLRDQQSTATSKQAILPDLTSLMEDFTKLGISAKDNAGIESTKNGDKNKQTHSSRFRTSSGKLKGVVEGETPQVNAQPIKKSLVVKLPISVDPVVLQKCNHAVKNFIGVDHTLFASLSINNLPIRSGVGSSAKGLTTAAAQLYQHKKLVGQQKKKLRCADTLNNQKVSPCDAVFGTTELLEIVLVHLPPKTILYCQSVCHSFKNCYKSSKQLQIKTFEQVSQVDRTRVPTHTIINSMPQLPFVLNSTFFYQAPRQVGRRSTKLVYSMPSPTGVKSATFTIESDRPPVLALSFDHYSSNPSWDAPQIGSWTKQYLIDGNYSINVELTFCDSWICDGGRRKVTKTATVTLRWVSGPMGKILEACREVNTYLIKALFKLPASCSNLYSRITDDVREQPNSEARLQRLWALLPSMLCDVQAETSIKKFN